MRLAEPKMATQTRSTSLNPSELYMLNQLLLENVEDLLNELGIQSRELGTTVRGYCPIHMGDNPTAFSIKKSTGYWTCYSGNCNRKYGGDLIGLIRSMLDVNENKTLFSDAIDYCIGFLKIKRKDLHIDAAIYQNILTRNKFNIIHPASTMKSVETSRKKFRQSVEIPCKFMVDKGFNLDIINRYDAGLCRKSKFVMQNRVVLPIYDNDYNSIIGFVGRSIFDKCGKCKLHHDPSKVCLGEEQSVFGVKWFNYKVNTNAALFNYWHSKKEIQRTNTAIIVEGQWDCMKLEQAGIKNSIGIFGSDISDQQLITLERSGAMRLVIATDNDRAGLACKKKIKELCGNLYDVVIPEYPAKDIDELSASQIQEIFGKYYKDK